MFTSPAHIPSTRPGWADPHFIVGQDADGHWLAVETTRLGGGLFRSRADVLHFVQFETARRPGAVEFDERPLQLPF